VVHDIDRVPTCQEAWVRRALRRIPALAVETRCRALALPLLGSVHGCLEWRRSLALVLAALGTTSLPPGLRVWLQVPVALGDTVRDALAGRDAEARPRRGGT
jgi:hypothetical protein